jgi:hypothetical protein
MFESFSASGFFVHTPCGPRKSGMPDSVEMPAPVSTTMRDASSIQPFTSSSAGMPDHVRVMDGQRCAMRNRYPFSSLQL